MGRPLPKRECPICGRRISIMSNVTRHKLRDHKCVPKAANATDPWTDFRRLADEALDNFDATAERLIAEFPPEEKEQASAALTRFREARKENQPLVPVHNALSVVLRAGALKCGLTR